MILALTEEQAIEIRKTGLSVIQFKYCIKNGISIAVYNLRQRGIEQMAEHDPSATAKRQMNHKPYQAAVLIREQGEQMRRETAESWLKRKNVLI